MAYLGNYAPGGTIYFHFTTVNTSGVPTQLAGTPAISVYKDNSTTQSTAGITLTVDFDTVTGLNYVAVDTSADGTFYAAGSDFSVVITTGTVSGASVVGYVVARFSLTKATVKTATDVETDTADIQSRIPAALVGGRMDANVGAISADATAADNLEAMLDGTGGVALTISTLTVTTNAIAWNASWDAEVQSEVDDALVAQNLDHLVKIAVDTNFATTVHADSVIGQIADNGAGFDRTTDSLEAIRDNMGTAQTGDAFARLGAPAGASVSADIAAVKSDTAAILDDTGTSGVVVAAGSKTGYALTSAYDFAKGTTAMTEAYAANGAAPTPAEALFAIHQMLMQFTISGTSLTVKKLDNSTTAFVVTLNDATTPTGAART